LLRWSRRLHHQTLERLEQFHKSIYKNPPVIPIPLDPHLCFFIDHHHISSNENTYRLWLFTFRYLLCKVVMEQRIDILSVNILHDPSPNELNSIEKQPNWEYVQMRWQWEAVDAFLKEHHQEGISLFVLESREVDTIKQHHLYFTNPPRLLFHLQP
jgi:hypothetical protein